MPGPRRSPRRRLTSKGNFVPTVRLNPGMVTDMRTTRGTTAQGQLRRAARSGRTGRTHRIRP